MAGAEAPPFDDGSLDLVVHELRAPEGDDDEPRFFLTRGWARRWPCEDVWVARRRP